MKLLFFMCVFFQFYCSSLLCQNYPGSLVENSKERIKNSHIKSETQWLVNLNNPNKIKVSYKTYSPDGLITKQVTFGNGDSILAESSYQYDAKGKLISSSSSKNKRNEILFSTYAYDANDKLVSSETHNAKK